jgi:hypothetical protein
MAGLETEQIVKLILGILVVVTVVVGLYFAFKNNIFDFFKGISVGNTTKLFLTLIK